jgi:RNA polymerase sigma factor (sigma-70 family)
VIPPGWFHTVTETCKNQATVGHSTDIGVSADRPQPSDRDRFEELWRRHYGAVFAYALRRLGDEHAADDVVADTFLVGWRRRDSIPESARPWLLGVARKQLANRRRGDRRRAALTARLAESTEPPNMGAPSVPNAALAAAFNALSPSDREVLGLIAWDELKPREAAAVLGVAPALFSVRLHRARRRLGRLLSAADHAPADDRQGSAAGESPTPPAVRMETR